MLRRMLCLLLALPLLAAAAAGKPVPAGPLKAFRGPEGEVITMMEVNDSKQMLVHFKGIGGEYEGQTRLYEFEDQGKGRKEIFYYKKRGSKTLTLYIMSYRDGRWTFFHPTKGTTQFDLSYSEKDSEKMKAEDLLAGYKP